LKPPQKGACPLLLLSLPLLLGAACCDGPLVRQFWIHCRASSTFLACTGWQKDSILRALL
jgi:hypothetical protein